MKKFFKSLLSLFITAIFFLNNIPINNIYRNTKAYAAVYSKEIKISNNENYYGFKLTSKEYIESIKSTLYEFEHNKSGGKLIFLQNDDDNKIFSITFRTPPNDNSGVNHIIEHSVLCGSKKYPVKDPFLIMKKQSLNTFLNAMTSSDYTSYPIASRNDKDFKNLMSIYLDAVFFPNLIKDERIFRQEGWRYELNSPNDELIYNGIVYNEMKGIYSSPYASLSAKINESLFPDTIYKWESGGNPNDIPKLTYDKLLKTYEKYYKPSNSLIYLYGNINISETLKFIDNQYLGKFIKTKVDSEIPIQKPFAEPKLVTSEYNIPSDEDINSRSFLALNYVTGTNEDRELVIALQILSVLLMGTPSSPLKMELSKHNLGSQAYVYYNPYIYQPIFSFIIENSDNYKMDKFKKITDNTLRKIVENGFSKDHLEGVFNKYELISKQSKINAGRGMYYGECILNSWLYGSSFKACLETDKIMETLKRKSCDRYFEQIIEKYFLNNTHSSSVTLIPKRGFDANYEEVLKQQLSNYKSTLSEAELNELINSTKKLKRWQEMPDSKKSLSKLPTLELEDLKFKPNIVPTEITEINNVKVLNHPTFTNDICYLNIYFDESKIPQDKLMYLFLLCDLFGNMNTQKYNLEKLSDNINKVLGEINSNPQVFVDNKDPYKYYPKMVISMDCLSNNLTTSFELLNEIIFHSDFSNKELLKNALRKVKMNLEYTLKENGMFIATSRAMSYLSDYGKYKDLKLIPYYEFITNANNNFDNLADEIILNLENVKEYAFNQEGCIVSFTGDTVDYNTFIENFNSFSTNLSSKVFAEQKYNFDYSVKNEAFVIPSKVQYVVKAGDYKKAGYEKSGKLEVLKNVITNEYIWSEVRLKGGAYGGDFSINDSSLIFSSYRDPNLKETLNIYDGVVSFLKNFNSTDREMKNYIIGAINEIDPLMGPISKANEADEYYIRGITEKDIIKYYKEILSTTAEDIRNYADMLEKVLKQNNISAAGREEKIDECRNIFDKIIK